MNTTTKTERREKRDGLTQSERARLRNSDEYAVSQVSTITFQAAHVAVPADFFVRMPYGGIVAFVDSNTGNSHTVCQGKCDCPYHEQHGHCKHVAAVAAVRAHMTKERGGWPTDEERRAKVKAEMEAIFGPRTPAAPPMVPPTPANTLPTWAKQLL